MIIFFINPKSRKWTLYLNNKIDKARALLNVCQMRSHLKDWFKINITKYTCDTYVHVCVGYNSIKNDFFLSNLLTFW